MGGLILGIVFTFVVIEVLSAPLVKTAGGLLLNAHDFNLDGE